MRLPSLFFATLACLAFAAHAQEAKPESQGGPKPAAKPQAVPEAKAAPRPQRTSRAKADADARHCLAEPTTTAIIKCAEAYL